MSVSPSKGTSPQGHQQKRVVAAKLVPQRDLEVGCLAENGPGGFEQVPHSRSRSPNFLRRSPTHFVFTRPEERTPPRSKAAVTPRSGRGSGSRQSRISPAQR